MIFVTGVHGDEYQPHEILKKHGIKHIVANKLALKRKVRFIEKDMNASFKTKGKTYEEKRADILLCSLKGETVIDLHSFSCVSEPFAVVVDKKMIPLAQTTGLKIVYMKHNIKKGHALINHVDGISIELGDHDDPKMEETLLRILGNIKTKRKFNKRVYEAIGLIEKEGKYENFKKYNNFYPVLAGEKAYDHLGLMTKLL